MTRQTRTWCNKAMLKYHAIAMVQRVTNGMLIKSRKYNARLFESSFMPAYEY